MGRWNVQDRKSVRCARVDFVAKVGQKDSPTLHPNPSIMPIPIHYIELYAPDLEAVKTFYTTCFGWRFTDYGPGYTAFSDAGLEGGFEKIEGEVTNGALVVLYCDDLEGLLPQVLAAGGTLAKAIFSFPGGRRFEFFDPAGNRLAVWCEVSE